MEPWFRVPKNPNGKSFDDEANKLPPFSPFPPPRTGFRPIPGCGLHYGEPLPRPLDDRYGLKLSSHFLLFEREAVPLELRFLSDELCSGFLSDGVAPSATPTPPRMSSRRRCRSSTIPRPSDGANRRIRRPRSPHSPQIRQIRRSLLPRA
jgi:hypothetical protein